MDNQDSGNANNPGGEGRDNRDWRDDRRDWRENRSHDPMRGLFWGLILVLLGVLLFGAMQDWLRWDTWWQIFLVGLGVIFLVEALVHSLNSSTKRGVFGRVIAGLILITVGAAFLIHIEQWWPLILIVIGIAIISRFIISRH